MEATTHTPAKNYAKAISATQSNELRKPALALTSLLRHAHIER